MIQLPVTQIAEETLAVVWQKRVSLLRALIGPGVIMACLDTIESQPLIAQTNWLWKMLLAVADGAIFTLFAISCHRIVLLGGSETPRYGIYSWSPRETRFLGWTMVGVLYFLVISMIMIPLGGLASRSAPAEESLALLPYVLMLPGAYVFSRLTILLPATALGERHDMKWAWEITSNNGWRLVLLVVLIPLLVPITASFFEIELYPVVEIFAHLLGYALVAIEIAALSVSFKFLAQARTLPDSLKPA